MIGKTISHYRITDKLGEGGMGVVYKAHDTTLDRYVALKFLPAYLTSDATEKERFYHEARAASSLNHPNITIIHEIAEFEGQIYMAMEYIEGKTLKHLVQSELPPLKKVLDLAIQVCEGLSAAEEKKIVHRDIKADNIMLTPKGQVKIMDFGLAKVKGASKLTRAGSTLGTAAYMSPEQAQGEDVDHRSDIFSFGVVLYELLTANLPFRGEHQAAMMYSLINEDPAPIPRFNTSVSPELERIVAKALAKDREERYQHIDDMLADLRRERKNFEYARAGYVRSTASVPAMAPAAPKRRTRTIILAVVAVVAVLLVLVLFNPFNFQITTQRTEAAGGGPASLAVLYFQNIADPQDKDHVGDMLADLLITSLSQSRKIEVISRERLYDIQKELQADAKVISPDMASKVARRAGVTTMLLGSIIQLEPQLMVTTRLIDVQSGKILNSERVSGFTQRQIFGLVDTLSLLVQRELAGAEPAPGELKSVTEVTTSSPEAYRSYIEAVDLNNKFFYAEAYAAFRRAIELDSGFAMAYAGLATANGPLPDLVRQEAIRHAWRLRQDVTELERLAIESQYAGRVENDMVKEAEILETLVQKYPKTHAVYQGLASVYVRHGDLEKARDAIQRGIRSDSLDKNTWNNLGYISAFLNDRHGALAAMDRYASLAPAEPNPYDSRGDILMMFDSTDAAMLSWQKAVSFRPDFPSAQKLGFQALLRGDALASEKYLAQAALGQGALQKEFAEEFATVSPAYRGQLRAAREAQARLLASRQSDRLRHILVVDYSRLAWFAYEIGDAGAMLDYAQRRSAVMHKNPADAVYGRDLVAIASARAGKHDDARRLLDELSRERPTGSIDREIQVLYASALVLLEEGDNAGALAAFGKIVRRVPPVRAPLYFYGLCLLNAGRVNEAVGEFRRSAVYSPILHPGFDLDALPSGLYWPIPAVKSHYWLGVAYEKLGKKSEAATEYEKFLQIWDGADFRSKELTDAKARLAALEGTALR